MVEKSVVEAQVKRLATDGIEAERLDRREGGELLKVPYAEAFFGQKPQHHPGLARCGDEIVRVGDVIRVCQRDGQVWTRKPIMNQARQRVDRGLETVANARVEEIESDWLILATTEGLAARCCLQTIDRWFREKGIDLSGDSGSSLLQGRIRIGDPLAGFLKPTNDPIVFELDVPGYLTRLEALPVVAGHRRVLHGGQTAPREQPAQRMEEDSAAREVPCPPNLGTVLIIDDDDHWREKTGRWLATGGADVVVLPPDRWAHAVEEAKKADAKWIIVDVFLSQTGRPSAWGVQIAGDLVAERIPWKVVVLTIAPDLIQTMHLPERVIGPVEKTISMSELASVLRGMPRTKRPQNARPSPAAKKWQPHRSERDTERQITHILKIAEVGLSAKLAMFSYHILADRAAFRFGSRVLKDAFDVHSRSMHRSQIRDLAFEASDDACVVYPPGASGEWWFWLRKLVTDDLANAVGVRLSTPNRNEVWSLFAFWLGTTASQPPPVQDAFSAGTERDLLRVYASAIEDALWHAELDSELERARKEFEALQRSQNLAHEVRNEVSDIRRKLERLLVFDNTTSARLSQDIAAYCRTRCDHLHAVSSTLLRTDHARYEQHRIADILRECMLRYVSSESPVDIVGPYVEPKDLDVVGQKDLVTTLIDNLLRNAVQSVRQTVRLRRTDKNEKAGQILVEALRCVDDGRLLEILIHDTGCGISRFAEKRMNDRWFSTCGGTGLGMGICQDAVRRLGGRLEVKESARFVGTTFRIVLPAVSTQT